MSTNRDVVKTALQMLTVIDADENPSAEDGALGLRQMNNLMASLTADGIDLGFPPQDNLSETFPLDSTAEAQIQPLLAMFLQPFYPSIPAPQTVAAMAGNAMKQLRRASILDQMEESSVTHIPLGNAGLIYNITTDE